MWNRKTLYFFVIRIVDNGVVGHQSGTVMATRALKTQEDFDYFQKTVFITAGVDDNKATLVSFNKV